MKDPVYTTDLTIRFSETNHRGNLKVVSLFDLFQDVGSDHALQIGLSAYDLMEKNYTWVMLKYNVYIHAMPRWKDRVTVKTWRYPHRNLYELREFDILDASGNLMIKSLSCWVMMNFDSRKPIRLNRFVPPDMMEDQVPVEDDFSRLSSFDDPENEKAFNVRMQDIDFNNHVNNSVYIGWAVETVPQEIVTTHTLKQVEVNYINEISYGNRIYSGLKKEDGQSEPSFVHTILGGDDKRELTCLRTVWQPE